MINAPERVKTAKTAPKFVYFKWGSVYGLYAPVLKRGQVVERRQYRGAEEVRVRFYDRGCWREKWLQGWQIHE